MVWNALLTSGISSLPTRGAWIEMGFARRSSPEASSLPTRGAWIEMFGCRSSTASNLSLPTRGAWIEITCIFSCVAPLLMSLPTRGAWIEIIRYTFGSLSGYSRSPHGERGLKYHTYVLINGVYSRSPHGERGLKSLIGWLATEVAPGRSPHGERGLKCAMPYLHWWTFVVAPHTGSVD